ncbi:MAG: coenzyme F420-0:L-glutamate ligase, partial [Solirubrobacterales bacterium]
MPTRELRIRPLTGLPELRDGDHLGRLIAEAGAPAGDDVVVISQKAVSKVEGRVRLLAEVEPGERARELAAELDKDPAVVELVLSESARVVRAERGVLITETNAGWVCANAGIDASNLEEGRVSLLPVDGDASARRIRAEIGAASGATPAVVIADSFGRAWRIGQADVA